MLESMKKFSFLRKTLLVFLILGIGSLGFFIGQMSLDWLGGGRFATFQLSRSALASNPFQRLLFAKSVEGGEGSQTQTRTHYEWLELFNRVLHFVRTNYVDEIDEKKYQELIQGAIQGMLERLDPHSNFLPKEVFNDMKIETSGKFGGLGIEIGMRDNILTISTPIEDTPAWKAGLKPNDRIVKINSESTKGMTLMEAVSKMRGKPGTKVRVSIYREGFDKFKEVEITRELIKIQAVKHEFLEPRYGYVRLTTFNENAAHDLKKAIDEMRKKEKLSGLVFDLRFNPGGLLDQAVEVASLFIDEGEIVSTVGRKQDQKEVKYAKKGSAYKDFPLAILVGPGTASASEIVAGALQDHKRAVLLGEVTFGKGSVQSILPLDKDMGLKLTIARYFTPSGRSIQEKGVQPDILLEDFDPKLLSQAKIKIDYFRERDMKNHIPHPDDPESSKDGEEEKKKESETDKKRSDFKKEEIELLRQKKGKGKNGDKDSSSSEKDEEMVPFRFNPKEDYQVKQALTVLKSYEVLKGLKPIEPPTPSSSVSP